MSGAFDEHVGSPLLALGQAASLAGVSRGVVRGWCVSGSLPSVVGARRGERLIQPADLERHLSLLSAGPDGVGPLPRSNQPHLRLVREQRTGGDALRRIAAEVRGPMDLPTLFEDVIEDSMALFSVERVALWLYDGSRPRPFTLAAGRGLSTEMVERASGLAVEDRAMGFTAIRGRTVVVLRDAVAEAANEEIRVIYGRDGIGSVCLSPIVFRGEALGLLVLYHGAIRDWTTDETELARSFADQMAVAIGNAKLYDSVQSLAGRLRAIPELALRLNRVDMDTRMCEPIAFKGTWGGDPNPSLDKLRMPIGDGLTGWVAEHNQT